MQVPSAYQTHVQSDGHTRAGCWLHARRVLDTRHMGLQVCWTRVLCTEHTIASRLVKELLTRVQMAGEEHDGTMSERSRLQGLVRLTDSCGFVPGLGRDRGWIVPRVRVVSQVPLMAGEEHEGIMSERSRLQGLVRFTLISVRIEELTSPRQL